MEAKITIVIFTLIRSYVMASEENFKSINRRTVQFHGDFPLSTCQIGQSFLGSCGFCSPQPKRRKYVITYLLVSYLAC